MKKLVCRTNTSATKWAVLFIAALLPLLARTQIIIGPELLASPTMEGEDVVVTCDTECSNDDHSWAVGLDDGKVYVMNSFFNHLAFTGMVNSSSNVDQSRCSDDSLDESKKFIRMTLVIPSATRMLNGSPVQCMAAFLCSGDQCNCEGRPNRIVYRTQFVFLKINYTMEEPTVETLPQPSATSSVQYSPSPATSSSSLYLQSMQETLPTPTAALQSSQADTSCYSIGYSSPSSTLFQPTTTPSALGSTLDVMDLTIGLVAGFIFGAIVGVFAIVLLYCICCLRRSPRKHNEINVLTTEERKVQVENVYSESPSSMKRVSNPLSQERRFNFETFDESTQC